MSDDVILQGDLEYPLEPTALSEADTYQVEGKSFGIRALAYVIDSAILFVINYGLSISVGASIGAIFYLLGQEPVIDTESTQCINYIFALLMLLVYFSVFEGLYGASPGKLITGMRVVNDDGTPCNLRTAVHRGLWRFIDGILFGAVAYTNMEPPLQQRLGDKKARTLVVDKNEPLIQQSRDWLWFALALVVYMTIEGVGLLLVLAITIT